MDIVDAAIAGTVSAVVAGCAALFVRLRRLEARQDVDDARNASLSEAVGELQEMRKELHQLHVDMVRTYVSREEWVPSQSRILGALERQGESLARLEGRMGMTDESRR